jgi:hypothetical protein
MVFALGNDRREGLSRSEVAIAMLAFFVLRSLRVDASAVGNDRTAAYTAVWKASLTRAEEFAN